MGVGKALTGFLWPMVETSAEILWRRQLAFGFLMKCCQLIHKLSDTRLLKTMPCAVELLRCSHPQILQLRRILERSVGLWSSEDESWTYRSKFRIKILNYPRNRPWRPTGLWYVEDLTLSRQSAHRWWWCQPCAPAGLCSPQTLFFVSGTRFC
jgi:hypothetical protein